jgi:hypothetical protein
MEKLTLESVRSMIKEEFSNDSHSFLLESPEWLWEVKIHSNKYPFKALYMLGPAGAGKGHILDKVFKVPTGKKAFQTVNPDLQIEDVFPVFGISMEFANSAEGGDPEVEALQQKSRDILQNASRAHEANLIAIANPLIFDTTGEKVGKMVNRIKQLEKIGYDVAVMMINVPTEASVERDIARGPRAGKKGRTVGKTRTTGISQQYQKDVVENRGYYKKLEGLSNVTMLAPEVYNNIFHLGTGELLTEPTVITTDMLPDELNPEINPEAFAIEKKKIDTALGNLSKWLTTPVENPNGQLLLAAMKRLVKHPDLDPEGERGRLGQNMNDLVVAMSDPRLASDPLLLKAAKHLSALGGVAMALKQTKKGDVGAGLGKGEDAPYVQGAIRGKKDIGGETIRQMTGKKGKRWKPGEGGKPAKSQYEPGAGKGMYKENLSYKALENLIREAITEMK